MTPTPPAVPAPASRPWAKAVGLSAAGAVVALLLVCFAAGCTALAGGPVSSEADFLAHVRDTRAAGEDTVRFLGSDPDSVSLDETRSSASCVDDLGVDDGGISRDQPSVSWAPDFPDGDAGYRAAIAALRGRWSERGWKVTTEPETDPVSGRATGRQVIHTTDDHGVTLSLSPGRHTGEGRVVADGGCVRHEGVWETDDRDL